MDSSARRGLGLHFRVASRAICRNRASAAAAAPARARAPHTHTAARARADGTNICTRENGDAAAGGNTSRGTVACTVCASAAEAGAADAERDIKFHFDTEYVRAAVGGRPARRFPTGR
ncbi:hypothetical protein EVAR_7219_1 [Eumeta japonica]|uniref:Uncharacterized protein n=1 Tax=Eumeta variegata TaxID=151549 RepID=A0A4C1T574_EUMVA|nr:hypothetical protein EVAR_7219_1 [Eumeta japonica]